MGGAEFERLMDAVRVSVIATDAHGRVVGWNAGAEALFGWSSSEMLGGDLSVLYPEGEEPTVRSDLALVSGGQEQELRGTWTGRRKDGSQIRIDARTVPVRDQDGKLLGYVGFADEAGLGLAPEDGVRRRDREWKILNEVAALLTVSFDLDSALSQVARLAVDSLADLAWIDLYERDVPRRVAAVGADVDAIAAEVPPLEHVPSVAILTTSIDSGPLVHHGVRSMLVLPLRVRDRRLGTFTLAAHRPGTFDKHDVLLGEAIGRWLGAVIDNARLAQGAALDRARLVEESARNATLLKLGSAFALERDPDRLLQLVKEEATALTGAAVGVFLRPPSDLPLFDQGVLAAGAVRLPDVRSHPRFVGWLSLLEHPDAFVSCLAVPVRSSMTGDVLGGLFFGHPQPGRFTAEHEQVAIGVAAQAATALENARLVAALTEAEARARSAADAALEADRRKDAFLAMLGHELRNPLGAMRAAIRVAAMRGTASDEHLVLERQVGHLSRLLEDLLDVARITRGAITLSLERVVLSDVVSLALEVVRPLVEERGHEVIVRHDRPEVALDGDSARLVQVVSNLLSNAARYTPAGGRVEVDTEVRDGTVRITVRDNGRGISRDKLDQVFDVFVQLGTDLHRPDGGLGLGLAIVKSLVTAHGGVVRAHSAGPGLGSEFVVELPVGETMVPAEERSPGWGVPGVAADILVVDDNHDAADMLGALLTGHGHRVRVVYDGQAALDAFVDRPPTLVLLDIGLPSVDGFEVARRVREQFGRGPRLVALSGYGQRSDLERSAASGFDLHLVKPVDIDEILAAIR